MVLVASLAGLLVLSAPFCLRLSPSLFLAVHLFIFPTDNSISNRFQWRWPPAEWQIYYTFWEEERRRTLSSIPAFCLLLLFRLFWFLIVFLVFSAFLVSACWFLALWFFSYLYLSPSPFFPPHSSLAFIFWCTLGAITLQYVMLHLQFLQSSALQTYKL